MPQCAFRKNSCCLGGSEVIVLTILMRVAPRASPTKGDDMTKFEHLTEERLDQVTNKLWEIESSLTGLSGLFRIREERGSASIDTDELYGIGNMLKGLADKLSVQEDILRCGFDSMAVTKAPLIWPWQNMPPRNFKRKKMTLQKTFRMKINFFLKGNKNRF